MRIHNSQLSLAIIWRDDVVVLFVDGELDFRSASVLARTLDGLWAQHFTSLWIDLSGASRIDSAGVRALLRARERAIKLNREFVIRSPSSEAARLLERSGVWQLFSASGP